MATSIITFKGCIDFSRYFRMLLFLTVTAVILSIIILSIDFNVFFSIRCTANGEERIPNHEMLSPLYTAFMQWRLRYTASPLAAKSLNDMFIAQDYGYPFSYIGTLDAIAIALPQFHLPLTAFVASPRIHSMITIRNDDSGMSTDIHHPCQEGQHCPIRYTCCDSPAPDGRAHLH